MSLLTDQNFLKTENGKQLKALLDSQAEAEAKTQVVKRQMSMTEDVVILREMALYTDTNFYDEAYRKIARMLKLTPERVESRYKYLKKHNAKIEKNLDGTVKNISITGLRHNKIKRQVDSKLIEAIEVRCDVLESLMEKNAPATVLSLVRLTKSLESDDLDMLLWEIIKANKDRCAKIMTDFMEDELVNQLIERRTE